jgi:hypothetical protein
MVKVDRHALHRHRFATEDPRAGRITDINAPEVSFPVVR